jgi:hypothetical protein
VIKGRADGAAFFILFLFCASGAARSFIAARWFFEFKEVDVRQRYRSRRRPKNHGLFA